MKRLVVILIAIAIPLSIVVSLSVLIAGHVTRAERAYTAAEVVAGLQRQPQAWVGRTVLVRGLLRQSGTECQGPGGCAFPRWAALPTSCSAPAHCRLAVWDILDDPGAVSTRPLIVVSTKQPSPAPDIVGTLRDGLARVPGVGRLVPSARALGYPTYHVRLLPPGRCAWRSYNGVLAPCSPDAVRV